MALQGPFAVIADHPARDVVEALRAVGAYPIIESRWADARAAGCDPGRALPGTRTSRCSR